MSEVDFKNALMAGDSTEEEETREVKTYAGVVVVRALTRKEVLQLNGAKARDEVDVAEFEQRMVSLGMVSPKMTPAEVSVWQDHDKAGGPLEEVTRAITELSKLYEGADKSGLPAAG